MDTKHKFEDICPECYGEGWVSGSEAGHGCDGSEEDCQRTCPVQVQIQVGCEMCGGTGKIVFEEIDLLTKEEK